jgi:dolichol-phosphate mannosyltransferase
MLASSAPVVAVIDADLQHDERLLPKMFELIQGGDLDVVVGSRYVESGGIGNWDSSRAAFSRWATQLSRVVLKADLKDPMSGFFMIRHEAALACIKAGMSGVGFKILLDLFATSPTPLRHRELPYEFRNRVAGESKLDTNVAWEYFIMLLDKFTHGVVPSAHRVLIGGRPGLVHLIVLAGMFKAWARLFCGPRAAPRWWP